MNKILLEKKYILEYVKSIINDTKIEISSTISGRYHHNTSYKDASSILNNGILTMRDIKRLNIKKYSLDYLNKMSDTESHINGIDKVSLSVAGLTDLYDDEFEYNPFAPSRVDFIVSNDIKAYRSTLNYGNEFLSDSISKDKLIFIDVRILKLIDNALNNSLNSIEDIIEKYNYLRDIAITIKQNNMSLPLREMSLDSECVIDTDKLSSMPILELKK